ncbi:MAG: tetratricopeptide repeat protein [Alphaproteobacteria bacterium]|nr:tetratricopeptide repeat protein [Alphaproteobacteria bacterium]
MKQNSTRQMTNTQKAGDAVRMVADGIKDARKKLSKLSPKKHFENAGRVSGAVLLWLMEYTMRIANGLVLDNFALRAMERGFKNKKKDGFAKRNPALVSHALYYLIPLLAWLGVETVDFAKERVQERKQKEEEEARKKAMSFDNFKINPNVSDEEWEKQIDAIQPYVIAHLFLTEGYVRDLYYDNGTSGTKTIGVGFILDDEVHRKFAKKILGRPIVNGLSVSVEEARILADAWTREKIYPKMKEAFNVPMDAKLFITLVVAAYNAGESTYSLKGNSGIPVRDAVNAGKTIEEIMNVFVRQYGKVRGTQWGGMSNKYSVCALYALGDISDDVILNCVAEAPYEINVILEQDSAYLSVYNPKTMNEGNLLIYDGEEKKARPVGVVRIPNIEEVLQTPQYRKTKGTEQLKIRDYLMEQEVNTIMAGEIFEGSTIDYFTAQQLANSVKYEVSDSDKINEEGEELYHKEQYKEAIQKFEEALNVNPENYIVYSNISLAYYKMGEPKKGARVIEKFIKSEYFDNAPDVNKGYVYYNLALCYEKIGDSKSKRKQKFYKEANNAIERAQEYSGNSYDDLKNRINKKLTDEGKKIAFNSGIQQMRQKNAKKDILLYGKETTFNA